MAFAKKTRKGKPITQKEAEQKKRNAAKVAKTIEKAKHTAVLTKLNPIAKEINVRLAKAAKLDGDANDHRLAASLQAAKAKAVCEKESLPWKKWVESNLKHSYETVRKLAVIGASDNPAEALAGVREKNRTANVTHRETRRVTQQTATADAKVSPYQAATKAVDALEDKPVLNLIESKAQKMGMRIVSETDHKDLKEYRKSHVSSGPGLKTVIAGFDDLKPSEQMELAEHAAKKVGCNLVKPEYEDNPNRPPFLDRKVKRGVKE